MVALCRNCWVVLALCRNCCVSPALSRRRMKVDQHMLVVGGLYLYLWRQYAVHCTRLELAVQCTVYRKLEFLWKICVGGCTMSVAWCLMTAELCLLDSVG
jgi:hypothetical protein